MGMCSCPMYADFCFTIRLDVLTASVRGVGGCGIFHFAVIIVQQASV